VLRCCRYVDHVLTLEELRSVDAPAQLRSLGIDAIVHVFPQREVARWARQASIPMRIGTSHRWWHWMTCNERPSFSRKRSDLHEAQLNVALLAPLEINEVPDLTALAAWTGFTAPPPDDQVRGLLRPGLRHVILHPLSKGSAVEWGLDRFAGLMQRLDPTRYRIIVTGTSAEAARYRNQLPLQLPHVVDADGRLSLDQLIQLIGVSDALVAASTGPLHIAAACGKRAIGLYAPQRPIHPGRWAPIGADAHALVATTWEGTDDPLEQIRRITVDQVLDLLDP
jgi:ADP-heptose:LPS heptosyltransferase